MTEYEDDGILEAVDHIEESMTSTEVYTIPKCDFCTNSAAYDGRTVHGPWAYMCRAHFATTGVGLGMGRGQRLILRRVER